MIVRYVKYFVQVDALGSDRSSSVSPDDWAAIVHQELKQNGGNLTHLTALASHYLTHLIIAFRNPGGKKTPQDSIHTPNIKRIEEIGVLFQSATVHLSQSALRDLVLLRDGTRCPITRYPFVGYRVVAPRCAHIIPFAVHSKIHVHHAIETFTGQTLRAELVQEFINHPANAMNIQGDAHDSMDRKLAWGIEARLVDHKWKFGRGNGGDTVQLPDPRICNLHLAVARVFATSGAAEVFDKYLGDEHDMTQVPVYFG
ncbi:hypothetical protein BJV78DRAFT_441173 [Lactifluus subvellereus]|nr:hypothetical protein BJV78DRAFT_441173 [Lactifluus subvellereus]